MKPGVSPQQAASVKAWLLVVLLVVHLLTTAGLSASSACSPACTKVGTCNEELGRCDCPRHLGGPDCSEQLPLARTCKRWGFDADACTQVTPGRCLNNCTARGNCIAGWCHCETGFYGADCSLSVDSSGTPQLLAGLGYKPATRGPFIYIYEVPPRFNTWRNIEKFDRPLYSQLCKRIISSGHRTLDPEIADYYYIPADFRYLYHDASEVLSYVQRTWPYWNRTHGARHLLLSTSDLGGCEGAQLMRIRNMTANSTWITAWGLTRKHPKVWWPGCHRPGLDIVIPIPAQTPGMLRTPLNIAVHPKPERNITFFFAGKICGDNQDPKPPGSPWPICQTPTNPLYSAGMRQQVYLHHSAREGYKIVPRSPTYVEDMSMAKFCLAPTGGGHGKRQVLVARFGCIPVPITDYVLQPFEPELPWEEFSAPVAEADVPRMHEILAAISPSKLEAMQKALSCASRHLWWSTMWGGIFGEDGRYDAFATLMEILAARRRHPGVAPQDLIKIDSHFAKFARCELGDDTEAAKALMASRQSGQGGGKLGRADRVVRPHSAGNHGSSSSSSADITGSSSDGSSSANRTGTIPALCSYGYDMDMRKFAATEFCQTRAFGKYGTPGGAVCEGAASIATCPRPWE